MFDFVISPWVRIVAICAATCIVVFGSYSMGHKAGYNDADSKRLHDAELVAQVRNAAQQAAAAEIAKIEVKNVTIRQQIQGKVLERTVYRECRHDADSLRLINDALSHTAESSGGGKLPATDPAGR